MKPRPALTKLVLALAAMAAIALLSIPTVNRARDNARRASCQSNLKSISLRMLAYIQDYDNRYPPAQGYGGPTSVGYGWAGAMSPYLGSIQMLHCPSDPNPQAAAQNKPGFSNYWFNGNLPGVSQAKIPFISNTFLFGDGEDGTAAYAMRAPETGPNYKWMTRHLVGANYSFLDGHVKWLPPDQPQTVPANSSVFTFRT